jgi:hypothetical protein
MDLFAHVLYRPDFSFHSRAAEVYQAVFEFKKSDADQQAVDKLLTVSRRNLDKSSAAQVIFAVTHLFNHTSTPDYPLADRVLRSAIARNNTRALAVALFQSLSNHTHWHKRQRHLWRLFQAFSNHYDASLHHVFSALIESDRLDCPTRYQFLTEFIHRSWLVWDGKFAERNVSSPQAESAYAILAFAGNPIAMANCYMLQSRTGNFSARLFDLIPDDVFRYLDIRGEVRNERVRRNPPAENVYQAFRDVWNVSGDWATANERLDSVLKWKPEARVAVRIARIALCIRHAGRFVSKVWREPRALAVESIKAWPNLALLLLAFVVIFVLMSVRIRLHNA